jgi:leucyl-tRNA synthetase
MGFDSFGHLPAGGSTPSRPPQHPALTTEQNIRNSYQAAQQLGFSYDWIAKLHLRRRYYKWTQWIFLKLFNRITLTPQSRAAD